MSGFGCRFGRYDTTQSQAELGMEIGQEIVPCLIFALDLCIVLPEHGLLIRETIAAGEVRAHEVTNAGKDAFASRRASDRPEVDRLGFTHQSVI